MDEVGFDGVEGAGLELLVNNTAAAVIGLTAQVSALVKALVTQSILPTSRSKKKQAKVLQMSPRRTFGS